MNRIFKSAAFIAVAALTLAGCRGSGEVSDDWTSKNESIIKQYVENTVNVTYENLAAETEKLVEQIKTLKANRTDANVQAACETFLEARAWWEKSEAFLYGAAGDFGIDPHIDSWPLDETSFNDLMNSPEMLNALDAEDGDVAANERLGNALLGFHGVEYILFKDRQPRPAAELTDNWMIYALAVAGDLRNHCYQLEVSWNEDAPAAHADLMEELEFNTTISNGNSYGYDMLNAGKLGSTYGTQRAAIMQILSGCSDIADEVGASKIGKPNTGEDVNYVESPYSQTSIIDFYNNIISIQNAYMGGIESKRDEKLSVHYYLTKVVDMDDEDAAITEKLEAALDAINNMKAPFVTYYSDQSAKDASDACAELVDALDEAIANLGKLK